MYFSIKIKIFYKMDLKLKKTYLNYHHPDHKLFKLPTFSSRMSQLIRKQYENPSLL